MKLNKITLESGRTVVFADMTYDEELELAESVTQALSKHWVRSGFRKTAEKLYNSGTGGYAPQASDLQDYLDFREEWAENLDEIGRGHDSPLDPSFKYDDSTMRAPTNTRGGETSPEWRSQWYADERRRAWREAWDNNKKALRGYSDRYRVFPGDSNDELESQELSQLQPFFDFVRKNMKTYQCSVDQAIREAMGHIPHAELSLEDLHELYPDYPAK